jgi:hypothetical protein
VRNDLGSLAAIVAEYRRDNERAVAGISDGRTNESADELQVDCGLVTVHPASNRTIESEDMTGSPSLTSVRANPERTSANASRPIPPAPSLNDVCSGSASTKCSTDTAAP